MELEGERKKRSRELDPCFSENFLDQSAGSVAKRLCAAVDIDDSSIVSILEGDDVEGDECYDQVVLDEAQERLVFGVMRSLEEELRVPTNLLPSDHIHQNKTSTSSEESERFSPLEHIFTAADISPSFPSACGEDSHDENFLDLPDLFEKPSQITDQASMENTEKSEKETSLPEPKRVDLGYLLEASDDELGISPSPRSESPSSEVGLASCDFEATEHFSSGSHDSQHQQSWHSEWDWSSGGHFDLEFENDPATQELIKCAFSNMKTSSIWPHSSIDVAATSLEPACASH